jgi:hypothetical protein
MNVLLGFSILEDEERMPGIVNAWLAERGLTKLVSTWETPGCYKRGKHMEAPLYGAVVEDLPLQQFLAFLRSTDWEEPQFVRLMVWDAETHRWRVIEA